MNIVLPAIFCSAEGFLDAATRAFFAEFNIWNSNVGLCAFAHVVPVAPEQTLQISSDQYESLMNHTVDEVCCCEFRSRVWS